jgi:hypothetical protein
MPHRTPHASRECLASLLRNPAYKAAQRDEDVARKSGNAKKLKEAKERRKKVENDHDTEFYAKWDAHHNPKIKLSCHTGSFFKAPANMILIQPSSLDDGNGSLLLGPTAAKMKENYQYAFISLMKL